ncbi:hypothetical protein DESUT3_34780 [Desulfuromonas versatilis]|uniref:MSHA biogenesis protein MshI n=1 Tax=Desulfuromonas versatilis TaxID=2802975 RepID=A0ABN6E4I1_9BACT|nr:pilus assembly protein PilM [Desulfuromonas versatilis]BCR06409.1 hypothetical protein DESUT3_34780 [Desulfuromonas versatilis]
MLKFPFRQAGAQDGVTGICEHPDGLGVVHLKRREGERPQVTVCRFIEARREQDRTALLQEAIRLHGLGRSRCVGVMGVGNYSLLQVDPPEVPEEEISSAVCWHIRDLIDYPVEEAIIDYFLVPNPAQPGRAKMAYVVAAPRVQVRNRAALLRAARLKVSAMDIPELVLRNLATLLPEEERGLALLQLGRHRGQITISRGGVLYLARSISVGAADLAEIAAEGDGQSAEEAGYRLQGMLDSIVLEIQRSLDFYGSSFSLPAIQSLVVAPLEQEVPRLTEYLADYLGISVRRLDLAALFEGAALSPLDQARCLPAFGAALRDVEGAP